jgi:hypothetical protein
MKMFPGANSTYNMAIYSKLLLFEVFLKANDVLAQANMFNVGLYGLVA